MPSMQGLGHKTVRFAVVAAFVYFGVSLFAAWMLVQLAVHLGRRPLDPTVSQQLGVSVENVSITAPDGAVMKAWFAQPDHPNGAAVILLHGVADNREGVAGFGEIFLRHEYAVLLPDSRAHGESGGALPTYGVLERDDVKQWAAWLRPHAAGCKYLFGESMGAAIAIQASAVTPGICGIAVESAFATFRGIANDRIAQMAREGLWFPETVGALPREEALLYVRVRYRENLEDASPLRAIQQSQVPTLLICGTADANIPMRHSQELYRAGRSHSELWIVEGADHGRGCGESGGVRAARGWLVRYSCPGESMSGFHR
jgi:fermentation-respiration switch protein FrsA (DUF1100 family)